VKKCLLIILDGLGDRSFASLGNKTPLQAAHTPTLDRIARDGANGLYHAASLGQALPSENAHFALFGFDPDDFPGRGVLEALGAGIPICEKDVALLAHLASLQEDKGFLFTKRDVPKASPEDIAALIPMIAAYRWEDIEIRFHHIKGLFGVLTMKGPVSPHITDTNHMTDGWPLMEVVPWRQDAEDEKAIGTAKALKAYLIQVYRQLNHHPVNVKRVKSGLDPLNGLVTQRAGRLKSVSSFSERYGLKGLSIASGVLFKGMSAYLGMDFAEGKDSDDPAADLASRLTKALDAFETYDFIHVHTKAPDEAAHKKDPLFKKSVIEALDRGIASVIDPFLKNPDFLVIITSDHSTPSAGPLIHSGEPVPLIMHGCGARRDGVASFDEIAAASGALGMVRGKEMMYLILNYLDRAKLMGIMDTEVDQAFWPGNYTWFSLND
jgi:2,3-bisphosphoglycerate-independent phosphoglycerate mutase